jgi:hypothetical protein
VFKRFTVGLAVGYVLGARAGQKRYQQITAIADRVMELPAVARFAEDGRTMASESGRRLMDSLKGRAGLSQDGEGEEDDDDDEHGNQGRRSWRDRLGFVAGGGGDEEDYEEDYEDDSYALSEEDPGSSDEEPEEYEEADYEGADDPDEPLDAEVEDEYYDEPDEQDQPEAVDDYEGDQDEDEEAPTRASGRGARSAAGNRSRQGRTSRARNGSSRPRLSAVASAARERGRVD